MSDQTGHIPSVHEPGHSAHGGDAPPQSSFWRSKTGFVTIAFLAIGAFFLLTEHRAHALGWLPWLILLACPLMMFMHGGHGGHGGHGSHGAHRRAEPPARSDTTPREGV
jgi:hypothetical protein